MNWGIVKFLITIALLTTGAFAQQKGDEDYVPRVKTPAYSNTNPRIVFDAAHNNIHMVDGLGDQMRYRTYAPFKRLAEADGYSFVIQRARFTPKALSGAAIIAIVNAAAVPDIRETTPDQMNEPAFCSDEISAIREFVERGGSLLLIADHYPMGGAASELASAFGVKMGNGYVRDTTLDDGSTRSMLFTGAALGRHPILTGRGEAEAVKRVGTFTGQSLVGPAGATQLLRFTDAAIETDHTNTVKTSAGGRSQGLAFTVGHGRVVILGEAAMLSSQVGPQKERFGGLNEPRLDNEQFALNVLHWLSRLI